MSRPRPAPLEAAADASRCRQILSLEAGQGQGPSASSAGCARQVREHRRRALGRLRPPPKRQPRAGLGCHRRNIRGV